MPGRSGARSRSSWSTPLRAEGVAGIYVMPQFGRYDLAAELVEAAPIVTTAVRPAGLPADGVGQGASAGVDSRVLMERRARRAAAGRAARRAGRAAGTPRRRQPPAASPAGLDVETLDARIERRRRHVDRWYQRIERWYGHISRTSTARVDRLERSCRAFAVRIDADSACCARPCHRRASRRSGSAAGPARPAGHADRSRGRDTCRRSSIPGAPSSPSWCVRGSGRFGRRPPPTTGRAAAARGSCPASP